ncbi:hypothetical protein G5C66_22265 [Nocardioides sp. KC13]|uniref:Uncharacterized protein n=1 Tax=Nocardioides turkmenicus TaxID=2711220 RepID=A0A6M1RA53_9ACTN|nr:hypothetical protein [Nocardioides sp. KC13]NGN95451.1 hypothetical protein [Nocardioides sp. KC13]
MTSFTQGVRRAAAILAALGSLAGLTGCGDDVDAKIDQLRTQRTEVRAWATELLTEITEAKAGEVTWTGTEWPDTDHETVREKATARTYAVLADLDITSFDAVAEAIPDARVETPGSSLRVEKGSQTAVFEVASHSDTAGRLTVTGASVEISTRDFAGSGVYDRRDDFPWPP